jgi:hypothetical protein
MHSTILRLFVCASLAIAPAACDDDPEGGPTDAGGDARDGGGLDGRDGGLSDVPRIDGAGDGADGLGADGPEVEPPDVIAEVAPETPDLAPEAPPADPWATCMDPKPGVSPEALCTKYMQACGFDASGGTANNERYLAFEDCVKKYAVRSALSKGCIAYHLCVAATSPANATLHCPHPPQASLPVPVGPGPCGNL